MWVLRDFPEDGLKVGHRAPWIYLAPRLVLILLQTAVDGGRGRIYAILWCFKDWETWNSNGVEWKEPGADARRPAT